MGLALTLESNRTTKAVLDELKHISEQNQNLSQANQAYIRCIADIFVKGTRDDALRLRNLDSCATERVEQNRRDEQNSDQTAPSSRGSQAPAQARRSNGSAGSGPTVARPPQNPTPPEPSVIQSVTQPVTSLLDRLL